MGICGSTQKSKYKVYEAKTPSQIRQQKLDPSERYVSNANERRRANIPSIVTETNDCDVRMFKRDTTQIKVLQKKLHESRK
jgi:hypothetical protein